MGKEIERKFLVDTRSTAWKQSGTGYRQGYLSTHKQRTVRVRTVGDRGILTIKGITQGASRSEFEYSIPHNEATQMLDELCETPLIEKTRYLIPQGKHTWEIDEFHGENQGLVVAEIELESEDEAFDKPDWVEKEVTGDIRYYNSRLVQMPYSKWGTEQSD